MENNNIKASEERLVYASILNKGMRIGLGILIVTFIIYLTGILKSHIPVNELPKYWGMPVNEYLKVTGIGTGWSWLGMLNKGDFLNFVGIAFLAGVSIICYIRIIPIYFRKNDTVYGVIAILEVLVLAFAASGILQMGGH